MLWLLKVVFIVLLCDRLVMICVLYVWLYGVVLLGMLNVMLVVLSEFELLNVNSIMFSRNIGNMSV